MKINRWKYDGEIGNKEYARYEIFGERKGLLFAAMFFFPTDNESIEITKRRGNVPNPAAPDWDDFLEALETSGINDDMAARGY